MDRTMTLDKNKIITNQFTNKSVEKYLLKLISIEDTVKTLRLN